MGSGFRIYVKFTASFINTMHGSHLCQLQILSSLLPWEKSVVKKIIQKCEYKHVTMTLTKTLVVTIAHSLHIVDPSSFSSCLYFSCSVKINQNMRIFTLCENMYNAKIGCVQHFTWDESVPFLPFFNDKVTRPLHL